MKICLRIGHEICLRINWKIDASYFFRHLSFSINILKDSI